MAVKYTLPFKSHDNISWRIDIATDAYYGDATDIRGVSEQAAMLAYDVAETDDPFSTFILSKLDINCYSRDGIDVDETSNYAGIATEDFEDILEYLKSEEGE